MMAWDQGGALSTCGYGFKRNTRQDNILPGNVQRSMAQEGIPPHLIGKNKKLGVCYLIVAGYGNKRCVEKFAEEDSEIFGLVHAN